MGGLEGEVFLGRGMEMGSLGSAELFISIYSNK